MKGMRVQSIIRELRGEKIDIIEYSEDPVQFATHALSPAKITRVTVLDPAEHHMEVIVDDSQLSLAIGKKGQNVRLAAKLLGWKIDIKSEEEKRQEVESQMAALVAPGAPVSVLIDYGMAEEMAVKLLESGVATIEKLGAMTPEELEVLPGIGPESVEGIQTAVVAYYSQFEDPASENAGSETSGSENPEEPVAAEPQASAEVTDEVTGEETAEVTVEALGEDPVDLYDPESAEERFEPGSEAAEAVTDEEAESTEQFGTIVDAGSPHKKTEIAVPESTPEKGSGE
jgi:N utilization substance protein A